MNSRAFARWSGISPMIWSNFQDLVKRHKLKVKKRDDFVTAFEYLREVKEAGFSS